MATTNAPKEQQVIGSLVGLASHLFEVGGVVRLAHAEGLIGEPRPIRAASRTMSCGCLIAFSSTAGVVPIQSNTRRALRLCGEIVVFSGISAGASATTHGRRYFHALAWPPFR